MYLQQMIIHVAEEVFEQGNFLFQVSWIAFQCMKTLCTIGLNVLKIPDHTRRKLLIK